MCYHKKNTKNFRILFVLFFFNFLFPVPLVASEPKAYVTIFLKPSNAIALYTKQQGNILRKPGQSKSCGQSAFSPRIMLSLINYPVSAVHEISRIVKDIAKHQYIFPVEISGRNISSDNSIFLIIKDSSDITALSERIALRFSHLRTKNIPEPSWSKLYPIQEAFIKKAEKPNVLVQFQPHILLLANGKKEIIEKYKKIKARQISGRALEIGVGYTNASGVISKVIASYPLRSQTALR